jgi:hypothetical protein
VVGPGLVVDPVGLHVGVDVDQQGNLTTGLGVEVEPGQPTTYDLFAELTITPPFPRRNARSLRHHADPRREQQGLLEVAIVSESTPMKPAAIAA